MSLAKTNLLELLATRVRVLCPNQVARLRFSHTKQPELMATQWLLRQREAGLLDLRTTMAHPIIDVRTPLLTYIPGDPEPGFTDLARRIRKRWTGPLIRTPIATATTLTKRRFGGVLGTRRIREREVTHDLHVSEIYLSLLKATPHIAKHWEPDDLIAQRRDERFLGFVPDAMIVLPEPTLIEFTGSYSARKLRAIHANYSPYSYTLY